MGTPKKIIQNANAYNIYTLNTEIPREVVGENVELPWTVHKLLSWWASPKIQDAQAVLRKMTKGLYDPKEVARELRGTGVKISFKQVDAGTEKLEPEEVYIFARTNPWKHAFGVYFKKTSGSSYVYDHQYPSGARQLSNEQLSEMLSDSKNYKVVKLTVSFPEGQGAVTSTEKEDAEDCQVVHRTEERGRLIVEFPLDTEHITWQEALDLAKPHFLKALAHERYRRSRLIFKRRSDDPKCPHMIEYDEDFVADTAPVDFVLSLEGQREAEEEYAIVDWKETVGRHFELDATIAAAWTSEIRIDWKRRDTEATWRSMISSLIRKIVTRLLM